MLNNDLLRTLLDFWWFVPLAGAGLVAYRFLGWRGLVAVATLGAAGGLYTKGKRDERANMEQADAANRSEAIKARDGIKDEVRSNDPGANRDKLKRWGVPNDPPSNKS